MGNSLWTFSHLKRKSARRNKSMKRIVSILLVLVLLIGMVPVTVSAASKATITSQPKSVVAAKNTTAKTTVKATGRPELCMVL